MCAGCACTQGFHIVNITHCFAFGMPQKLPCTEDVLRDCLYSLNSGGDQPLQLRASLDLAPVIRARGLFISLKFLGILEF